MNTPQIKVNFGSAGYKKTGYINIDWQSIVKPDVEHDLNKFPYPFETSSVDHIEAIHIIEHLDRPFEVMREFHRILKPNGTLMIKVPHFSRAMTHPEHFHGFDVTFPLYFDENFSKAGFYGVEFRLEKMELHWLAFFHLLPHMGYGSFLIGILKIATSIVSFLANLSLGFASRIWCFWVGGFDEIEFRFVAVK